MTNEFHLKTLEAKFRFNERREPVVVRVTDEDMARMVAEFHARKAAEAAAMGEAA